MNDETPTTDTAPPKKYDLIITSHARQRWIERIADPTRYEHLRTCRGCETCTSLINDIRNILRVAGRSIDGVIVRRYRKARDEGNRVTDISFQEAVKKKEEILRQYREPRELEFLVSENAILVVAKKPDQDTPVLLTIMSEDMIEGTIFRTLDPSELKRVFKRWHFERRMKSW